MRLIDADALKKFFQENESPFFENGEVVMHIDNAPTVDESKTDDLIVLQLDCLVGRGEFLAIRNQVVDQVKEGTVLLPNYMHVAYIGSKCNVEVMYEGEGGTEG